MAYYTGYIVDKDGKNLVGYFGIADASGKILAGPTDTESDGYYEISLSPGEVAFFGAKGYVDRTIKMEDLKQGEHIMLSVQNNYLFIGVVAVAALLYFSRKKKGVGAFSIKNDLIPIFWIVGGVVGFTMLKKLLEKLGIWDSPDTKALDTAGSDPNSFWSPNFWRKTQNYSYAIDTAQATQYANQVYDAFGIFNDNEEQVFAVFRALRTKANVSYLADVFQQIYHQDLLTFLRGGMWPQDRLSDADVNSINKLVSQLPNY